MTTPPHPNLRDLVRRLARVARAASMRAEGRTARLDRERVGGSKPGSAHLYFDRDLPASERLERSLGHWLEFWEAEVAAQVQPDDRDLRACAHRAKTRAVLAERGMDPTAVGFLYGMTTEGVRKLRGRSGRDPNTGVRVAELRQERVDDKPTHQAPLTARNPTADV